MSDQNAPDVFDAIIAARRADMQKRINEAKKQIADGDKLITPSFSVEDFKNNFLYFFTGHVKENALKAFQIWLDIAGSASNSVNLVDNTGKIVAVVPPMGVNEVFDPADHSDGISIGHIFREANAKATISPMVGQNTILHAMVQKINDESQQHAINDRRIEWEKLFSFFGTSFNNQGENKKVETNLTLTDDDVEYE